MTLKATFGLWITALVSISILGISLAFFIMENRLLMANAQQQQRSLLDHLSNICGQAYLVDDQLLMLNSIKFMTNQEGIRWASFSNPRGKIIAHSKFGQIGKTVLWLKNNQSLQRLKERLFIQHNQGELRLTEPVYYGKKQLGWATLAFSQSEIENKIEHDLEYVKKIIFIITIIMLVISITASLVLTTIVTRPIQMLAAAAKKIGEGRLDERILTNRKDEIGGLIKTFNDMSARLKELDTMKKDFVSQVTHELRSPLGELETYIQLMNDASDEEVLAKRKTSLFYMHQSTVRLSKFINRLLEVAKIEGGKLTLTPTRFNGGTLMAEVMEAYRAQAAKKAIELLLEMGPQPIEFTADKEKLRQVLSNLVSNAIKFTPKGGHIAMGMSNDQQASSVKIWVRDSGIGIPADDRQLIFEKFYQVKRDKRELYRKLGDVKGTGLGLAIVKGIIDAHRGDIRIEDHEDEGTWFQIRLPYLKGKEAPNA